jgi:hypothetical protein
MTEKIKTVVWNFSFLKNCIAGTHLIETMIRNCRIISYQPNLVNTFTEWARQNCAHLVAFDDHEAFIVFFESKSDLAKFLLKFQ